MGLQSPEYEWYRRKEIIDHAFYLRWIVSLWPNSYALLHKDERPQVVRVILELYSSFMTL